MSVFPQKVAVTCSSEGEVSTRSALGRHDKLGRAAIDKRVGGSSSYTFQVEVITQWRADVAVLQEYSNWRRYRVNSS